MVKTSEEGQGSYGAVKPMMMVIMNTELNLQVPYATELVNIGHSKCDISLKCLIHVTIKLVTLVYVQQLNKFIVNIGNKMVRTVFISTYFSLPVSLLNYHKFN